LTLAGNRNWRLLWIGQAVSLTGDSVFDITVLLWVATVLANGRPWAPAAASGVLVAAAVPVLIVGPVAGVLVDRWNRRRTMLAADACRAAAVASLLAVPAFGDRLGPAGQIAFVYAAVAAESCLAQFFNPSRLAVLGLLVRPADRPKASGMLQATSSGAAIAGPLLAAPLLFAAGPQWALIIDAASFCLSFAAVWLIRLPAAAAPAARGPGFRAEFGAGLRFFAGSRLLVALCAGVVVVTLGTGALNALEVFFLRDDLHAAARWLGVLYAATGAGAVAGALLGGWLASRIGAARVLWLALVAGGACLLGYSRLAGLPAAAAVVGLVGVAFGAVNTAVPPLLLAEIPQRLIGRVMSVFNPVQQVANIVSMAAAGVLAGLLPVRTIFAVSALLIIAAGLALIGPLRSDVVPPERADGDQREHGGDADHDADRGQCRGGSGARRHDVLHPGDQVTQPPAGPRDGAREQADGHERERAPRHDGDRHPPGGGELQPEVGRVAMARNRTSWIMATARLTPARAVTTEATATGCQPEPAQQLVLPPAHQGDRGAEGGA
jgi:MFS family permease